MVTTDNKVCIENNVVVILLLVVAVVVVYLFDVFDCNYFTERLWGVYH